VNRRASDTPTRRVRGPLVPAVVLERPKWGRFAVQALAPTVLCAICGAEWHDAKAKAEHLRTDHHAIVYSRLESPGVTVYEWRTP
jgi:hypothetical protein